MDLYLFNELKGKISSDFRVFALNFQVHFAFRNFVVFRKTLKHLKKCLLRHFIL